MKSGRAGMDLTRGPIFPQLISFAVPMVLANLVQQLYITVDLMVIGKFAGSVGTVAVATGGEVSDLMTPFAMAFSSAAQIYIAQLAGAHDEERIRETTGTLFTLMTALAVIALAVVLLLPGQILTALNCPEEAYPDAMRYMLITMAGAPFVFGYNAVCAILRGIGESKKPLIFVSIAAAVNVALDLFLVVVIPMGAAGTAIATVGSQIGAFLASFLFLLKKRDQFGFSFTWDYFHIRRQPLRIIFRLGIPQLVRAFCVQACMIWVKARVNSYGMVESATYSVGGKIEKFTNVFIHAVDGAAGAMIGQNIGAKKHDRVKRIFGLTLVCSMTMGVIAAALFLLVPDLFFGAFTDDTAVIEFGRVFLRIMSLACVTAAFAGTFKAIATGAGVASLCFLLGVLDGVLRVGICLAVLYLFDLGAVSYFWGAALCQVIPGCICMGYFFSGRWKRRKLLSET